VGQAEKDENDLKYNKTKTNIKLTKNWSIMSEIRKVVSMTGQKKLGKCRFLWTLLSVVSKRFRTTYDRGCLALLISLPFPPSFAAAVAASSSLLWRCSPAMRPRGRPRAKRRP
jgi:hypothetical protein